MRRIRRARDTGFFVELHYIGLSNWVRAYARVKTRVALGGHNVPEIDIRRRYGQGLANLPTAIQCSDTAYFYDNSTRFGHTLFAAISNGKVIKKSDDIPAWARGETLGLFD